MSLNCGVLVDYQIDNLAEAGMVAPFDRELVNPASLDVRLGSPILIESHQEGGWAPFPISEYTEEAPWLLKPNELILAPTVELFNFPKNVCGQFFLKSSRAWDGLEHLHAGWIDAGWHGSVLTMELRNMRNLHPIKLWPGMRIGQIVFHGLSTQPRFCYAKTGRYNNDTKVQGAKP